eukprot:TRINITY_DN4254_c0_g1_i10.p1 TRINITY_DN4254_c0_g1~~TRINITY_DN4254_c0_g1_i10.p1  ORF type:complete len:200 (+),score=24.70 TRINITY_DN4254_c0_g1_i10:120-719(+)
MFLPQRTSICFMCSLFCFLVGMTFIHLTGPESPNNSGRWDAEWKPGNCTVVESVTQTLPNNQRRAVFKVILSDSSIRSESIAEGVTAVAGSYGWGGYYDGTSNNEEDIQNVLSTYLWGEVYPCWYSTLGFSPYPGSSCGRCAKLIYFNLNDDERAQHRFYYTLFTSCGIISFLLSIILFLVGCYHFSLARCKPKQTNLE